MIAAIQFMRANWIWLVVAVLCILLGLQTVRLANEKASHAETISNNEREWSIQYKTAAKASQDNLNLYTNQVEALQKEATNAKKQRDKASADAVANANAGDRMRKQLAEARSRSCELTENTTANTRSTTTGAAINLFDYMQRRLDEAADGIAKYADEAAIAGETCEKSYDALRELNILVEKH